MDIDLIMFDWGGTLVSIDGQNAALGKAAKAVADVLLGGGDDAVVVQLVERAIAAERAAAADLQHREVDLAVLLADWLAEHGGTTEPAQIERAVQAVGECWIGAGLKPYPGAIDVVRQLREAGYRTGLVSNVWIPQAFCLRELDRQGFGPLMDFTVFSSQVGYRKPSPVIYDAALAAAFPNGRPADLSRVLFVGDWPRGDVIAPAGLGMRTALVASPPGTWPESDYDAAQPDIRIDAVSELPAQLDRFKS